jgi:XTP/dITP diphosphohydrolase
MKKIVFASNNPNKISEIQNQLSNQIEIISLEAIGCFEEIEENAPDIEGNASLKSQYVFNNYQMACFADDTGLEVDALNGAPGVYSARYAGPEKNAEKNIDLLLEHLKDTEKRGAQFKTLISLILDDGKEFKFTGIVRGQIIKNRQGTMGFGYDAVFMPEGYTQTFAEMSMELKNKISHRGLAVQKLIAFLIDLEAVK